VARGFVPLAPPSRFQPRLRSSSTEIIPDGKLAYYFGHLNDHKDGLGAEQSAIVLGQRAPMSETQRLSPAISSLLVNEVRFLGVQDTLKRPPLQREHVDSVVLRSAPA
jgi:hypothetical protein